MTAAPVIEAPTVNVPALSQIVAVVFVELKSGNGVLVESSNALITRSSPEQPDGTPVTVNELK